MQRPRAAAARDHASDQTEHAYWRGDMIDRRRQLLEDWGKFACPTGSDPTSPGKAEPEKQSLRLVAV